MWHFEILTWSQLENLKCGISRKRLIVERNGRKFPFLQFLKFCSSPSFHSIHLNFIQGIIIIQAVTFWRPTKNCKNYGILKFFLTQVHMQLEFSKRYFSHNFHWSPPKLCDNISYHGKLKCLLEYCNVKLASST